jgi:raffinose/stachyose/melibiose transport system permease protein
MSSDGPAGAGIARPATPPPASGPGRRQRLPSSDVWVGHGILIAYTLVALVPILVIIVNSFKSVQGIFGSPFMPPTVETFSLDGYTSVLERANLVGYFTNSAIVTVVAVLLVLLLGAMVAHAIVEYRLPFKNLIFFFFIIGILIPIRLGTVSLLRVASTLGLTSTLLSLILVYTAMCLPMAVFIFRNFLEHIPRELKDAARIDGAGEIQLFWRVLVPLIRPAVGTVAVFAMIPMWNDLWFASVLAPNERTMTVPLGVQVFVGQFTTDWPAVLASLTLAMVPLILLYMVFSRQLINGLTQGALK